MSSSDTFVMDDHDPKMQQVYENARSTFGYFWRELSWEQRRIIPSLDLACVKAPFSDGEDPHADGMDAADVEYMWISDIEFDGETVSGVLMNEPNALKNFKAEDVVHIPFGRISDWMYAIDGSVCGAYTVNLLRSQMDKAERKAHDEAWGLNFGDPETIRVMPEGKKSGGLFKGLFSKPTPAEIPVDHPMCVAMIPKLIEFIAKDRSVITAADDKGWTMLHREALAGNAAAVAVLLEEGANREAKTDRGMTAQDLAKILKWDAVIALLESK